MWGWGLAGVSEQVRAVRWVEELGAVLALRLDHEWGRAWDHE